MTRLSRVAPEIPVAEIAVAVAYYSDALGFDLAMKMADGHSAVVERDGVALHLFDDGARKSTPVSMHVFVDGLDEIYAEFMARGARIRQGIEAKPWGCRDFRVTDPSGNEIKFTEPLSES